MFTRLYALLLIFTSFNLSADEPDFAHLKLSDNLAMIYGINGFAGGNIIVSHGEDGVYIVDDSMPPFFAKLEAAIAKVTGNKEKPRFVINTHVHRDHAGGNAHFASNHHSHIVSHKNVRRYMQKSVVETGGESAWPVITFDSEMSMHLNGSEARIIHYPGAHTDGDAVVYFPIENIVHTGDLLFHGRFPFIDLSRGGSVDGYIAAQEAILALINEETRVVPGHGPLTDHSSIRSTVDILKDAKSRISKLKSEGKSLPQVLEVKPLEDLHEKWNWEFISTEKMVTTIYSDI